MPSGKVRRGERDAGRSRRHPASRAFHRCAGRACAAKWVQVSDKEREISSDLKGLIDDFVNSIYDAIDVDRDGCLEFDEARSNNSISMPCAPGPRPTYSFVYWLARRAGHAVHEAAQPD